MSRMRQCLGGQCVPSGVSRMLAVAGARPFKALLHTKIVCVWERWWEKKRTREFKGWCLELDGWMRQRKEQGPWAAGGCLRLWSKKKWGSTRQCTEVNKRENGLVGTRELQVRIFQCFLCNRLGRESNAVLCFCGLYSYVQKQIKREIERVLCACAQEEASIAMQRGGLRGF